MSLHVQLWVSCIANHHSFFRLRPVRAFPLCALEKKGSLSPTGSGLGGALSSWVGAATTNISSSFDTLLNDSATDFRWRRLGNGGGVLGTASSEADLLVEGLSTRCESGSLGSIGVSDTCGDAGADGIVGVFAPTGTFRAKFTKAEAVCALHVPLLSFAG
jgi:hypothetical protein